MAGMRRADQTMDTPTDVERPRPRAEPFDVVEIPSCAVGKDYPPGCGAGHGPCAIPELTQLAFAREAPHLKGLVVCQPGLHPATTTRSMTVVHDQPRGSQPGCGLDVGADRQLG